MIPEVKEFHGYLTEMCRGATFGSAVSATNYAVEGVAQKISEKALRGLAKNEKVGPRGRWWLEEHAKQDDEDPVPGLGLTKSCSPSGNRWRSGSTAGSRAKSNDTRRRSSARRGTSASSPYPRPL